MRASSTQIIALHQPRLFPVRSKYCSTKQISVGIISLATSPKGMGWCSPEPSQTLGKAPMGCWHPEPTSTGTTTLWGGGRNSVCVVLLLFIIIYSLPPA